MDPILCQVLQDFAVNLFAGVVGILIVLWLESHKKPSLSIKIGSSSIIPENDFLHRRPMTFLRVEIHNRNIPKVLSWVYEGEHAFSCLGRISFYHLDGQQVFTSEMLARWSKTQDPPSIEDKTINGEKVRVLINPQIAVDIPPGEYTHLDV